jgi:4,5-DOPA dioxygenase extradiol
LAASASPAPYVLEFSRWIESAMTHWQIASHLFNYRRAGAPCPPGPPDGGPFSAAVFHARRGRLGLVRTPLRPEYISREVMYSMLAMDAFALSGPESLP